MAYMEWEEPRGIDDAPEPMVLAFRIHDRELVPAMGCQRVIEPELDQYAKCQRLVEYVIEDGFSISGVCAEHVAEFRAKRPEWLTRIELVKRFADPYT